MATISPTSIDSVISTQLSGAAADTYKRLNSIDVVERDKTGFAALTPQAFIELMIAQLQNQDPLEPVGNDELLSQLSMMQSLQSNIELQNTLKGLGENLGSAASSQQDVAQLLASNFAGQRLSTAATLIGTSVTGSNSQTGIVDRAFLKEGKVFLGVGSSSIALEEVESINTTQSLVGTLVTGKTSPDAESGESAAALTGVVENAYVAEGQTYVTVRGQQIPIQNVTNVYSQSYLTGKSVTYQTAGSGGNTVNTTGKVESVVSKNGQSFIQIGGQQIPFSDVISVSNG